MINQSIECSNKIVYWFSRELFPLIEFGFLINWVTLLYEMTFDFGFLSDSPKDSTILSVKSSMLYINALTCTSEDFLLRRDATWCLLNLLIHFGHSSGYLKLKLSGMGTWNWDAILLTVFPHLIPSLLHYPTRNLQGRSKPVVQGATMFIIFLIHLLLVKINDPDNQCRQVHVFHLVSLLYIAVIDPYSSS